MVVFANAFVLKGFMDLNFLQKLLPRFGLEQSLLFDYLTRKRFKRLKVCYLIHFSEAAFAKVGALSVPYLRVRILYDNLVLHLFLNGITLKIRDRAHQRGHRTRHPQQDLRRP